MNSKLFVQIAGILSYALNQWLILVFLTRYYNVDISAQYIYYLAYFVPLSIFLSYGIRNGVASDKLNKFSFSTYLKVSHLGILIYIIIGFSALNLNNNLNTPIFIFVMLFKLNEMISEPYYGNFLKNSYSENYAFSRIYKLTLGLVGFFVALILEISLDIAYLSLYGYIISIYIIYFVYDKSTNNNINIHESISEESHSNSLKHLLLINFPLASSSFIIAVSSSLPKIIFGYENQGISLTIFGILLYFNAMALIPITAITQILFGRDKLKKISRIYLLTVVYSLIFIIFYLTIVPLILQYIYSIEVGYNLTSLILASTFGVIQIFITLNNFVITYHRNFKLILYSSVISTICNAIFAILMLKYGLSGALFAVVISGLITLLANSFFTIKTYKKTIQI